MNKPPVKKEEKGAISFVDSFAVEEVSVEDEQLREATVEADMLYNAFVHHSEDG